MDKQARNTICLWYDRDAEEAAKFWAETFPDSSVGAVHLALVLMEAVHAAPRDAFGIFAAGRECAPGRAGTASPRLSARSRKTRSHVPHPLFADT